MNYLQKIGSIIIVLESNGYINDAERIRSTRDSASVGSELLMSVTHELLKLININDQLQGLIGRDIIELKDYCWSIGLQVR